MSDGGFEDFEFFTPLADLKDGAPFNLTDGLAPSDHCTHIYDGNSQALEQTLASDILYSKAGPVADVVHLNAEFGDRV